MILSILAFFLSLLAIGFLIFIHEFGHYWMAKRVGMRVETFSIGFGSPIYEWKRANGEQWQVGWLPLGGYVKIAGTDKEIDDPYTVKDGFFGKSPWARMKVAFFGPFVNILFAFLIFTLIWGLGGRSTSFKFYNNIIGAVYTTSTMYQQGVRSGDEILSVNGEKYGDLNSLFLTFLEGNEVTLDIHHQEDKEPMVVRIPPPKEVEGEKLFAIPFTTAQFSIYDPKTPSDPPSGVQKNDLFTWFDGTLVYSPNQLASLVLDNKALLTIQRGDRILLRRVPRISVGSLKLDGQFKEELNDWQYESGLSKYKLNTMVFIPYVLNSNNVVEYRARFIDKEDAKHYFPPIWNTKVDEPLQDGDKILAIDGVNVEHPYQILKRVQDKRYLTLVYREPHYQHPANYQEALALFKKAHSEKAIDPIVQKIGTPYTASMGNYVWLKPIEMYGDAPHQEDRPAPSTFKNTKTASAYVKHIFDTTGASTTSDVQIAKQRNPFDMMVMSIVETYVPIYLIATGKAKMDMVRGPIGVFEVVAQGLMEGFTNALYTIAFISLNLALINLLPFPVLDGGSIVISAFEKFSGRRLTIKALERLIIPFALLILFAMVFFTFNDIMRFFKG